MTRARALLAVLVLALALGGCSLDQAGASVACEDLIDRRVGVELQHRTAAQGMTVSGEGPFTVDSAFVEPATGEVTGYRCTVERVDGGWRLVDLATDR